MILDCYRLAKYYSTSPDVFLQMTFSDIQLHLYRTGQLMLMLRRESEE